MSSKAQQLRGTTLPRMAAIVGLLSVQLIPAKLFMGALQTLFLRVGRTIFRSRSMRIGLAVAMVPLLFISPAARILGLTNNLAADTPTSQVLAQAHSAASNAFAQKGINIGNDQSSTPNAPYPTAQNDADLAYLKGKVSRIRLALAYGKDVNDVNNLKRLAVEAKKQGFHVQFGISGGADSDVSTYYNQWLSTDIVTTARWAQANHIDEFSIGNEEGWSCQVGSAFTTKTPKEVRDDVRSKVAEVRKVYSGSIVYADAEGTLDDWIKEGIGGLDRIYFNVYDTLPNFQDIITKVVDNFGVNHGGIGEWGAEHGFEQMKESGMSSQQYAQEIINRAAIVKKSGLPAYLFTLRMSPDGSDWGLILGDGTRRPGLGEFLNL